MKQQSGNVLQANNTKGSFPVFIRINN